MAGLMETVQATLLQLVATVKLVTLWQVSRRQLRWPSCNQLLHVLYLPQKKKEEEKKKKERTKLKNKSTSTDFFFKNQPASCIPQKVIN